MLAIMPLQLTAEALCRLGDLERHITVVFEQPPALVPCRVQYIKHPGGEISFPWRATREIGYCEARARALAEKFKNLGWSCQDLPLSDDPSPKERHRFIEDSTESG